MSKPFMFEKPLGMRDTVPELYQTKKSEYVSKSKRKFKAGAIK